MKMLLGGAWVDRPDAVEVLNPFDGSLVDTVPRSSLSDVEQALVSAERGARAMRGLTGYQRCEILDKVADLLFDRMDDVALTITLEEGKILAESRMEAMRAREILALSAEEAERLSGELVPLDGAPGVSDRLGYTVRVPCGLWWPSPRSIFPFISCTRHRQRHRIGNNTNYGLSAAIFAQNLAWAMRFARECHAGNLQINWGTLWRADLMPYDGLKQSGIGKEGPKYATRSERDQDDRVSP